MKLREFKTKIFILKTNDSSFTAECCIIMFFDFDSNQAKIGHSHQLMWLVATKRFTNYFSCQTTVGKFHCKKSANNIVYFASKHVKFHLLGNLKNLMKYEHPNFADHTYNKRKFKSSNEYPPSITNISIIKLKTIIRGFKLSFKK